jgi:hypothetical protein
MSKLKSIGGGFSKPSGRLIALAILALSGMLPSGLAGADGQSAYLPLTKGSRWVLRSPTDKDPIIFEVVAEHDGAYDVRFDNPWIPSILRIRPKGESYVLESLTVNGQTRAMPPGTIYWDFSARRGQSWQNAIGKLDVVSRDQRIKGRQQTFNNCIQFQETTKENHKVFWTFAPGVGFVQFGAFVLEEADTSRSVTSVPPPALPPSLTPSTPLPTTTPATSRSGQLLIGLSANPFATEPLTPDTVRKHFEQSLSAGVNYIYLSPKWNELESAPGSYKFSDLDFQIGQASRYKVPAVLNIRIVDTGSRAFPKDLENKSFRDPVVRERLLKLLEAMSSHLRGQVRYVMIGNEIDGYFKGHRDQVADYAALFRAGADKVKQIVPGVPVSTTITFDGTSLADSLFKGLLGECDFFSVTYYPLRPDFTVRDPGDVAKDISKIIAAAGGKPILLQEVGYPSGSLNGSSEEKQAQVFGNVLDQLNAHRAQFIGANFFLMSDLSDPVVDGLAQYYSLPNADRFKSFLKTLGMFDGEGHPKKSWEAFRQKAPATAKP